MSASINNNEIDDDATPDPCGARCCSEWRWSQGWFSLQDDANGTNTKIIDVAASFGPTSWYARLSKFGYMVWMMQVLIQKWYIFRTEPWFFLAYLTHWALIAVVFWSMLSLYNSFVPLPQPRAINGNDDESVSLRTKVSWLFYPIAANMSAIVTLLFWTVEYDYSLGTAPHYTAVMSHGGSFVLTWIEGLVINRIPIRCKHVLPTMIAGSIYIFWTVLHQLVFTDIGNPWKQDEDPETTDDLIYNVLDYKGNTGFSIGLVVAVIFIAIPLLHWTLWLLSLYTFPCGGCRGTSRRYMASDGAVVSKNDHTSSFTHHGDGSAAAADEDEENRLIVTTGFGAEE